MTIINYESDPRRPGRTAVLIVGETAAEVQCEITRIMRSCDHMTGRSEFKNPRTYYVSLGYVEVAL